MDRDECYKFKYLDPGLCHRKDYNKDNELNHIEQATFINKKMIVGFGIVELIRGSEFGYPEQRSINHPMREQFYVDASKLPDDFIIYEAGLTLVGDRTFYIRDKNIDNLLMKLQDYDIFVHRTGDSMHPSEVKKYCENCKVLEYCKENDIRPSKCRKCLMCFEASNFIQKEEDENANNMSDVIS